MLSASNLQAGEGNEPKKKSGKKHCSSSVAILRAEKVLPILKNLQKIGMPRKLQESSEQEKGQKSDY
ncbi:hypothetical protein EO95_13800 [Methanosarcina sp. 1.H.T.1A.1]|uniref:hypothetical protein n=1 Tax=Methanosarcina sp. 1.H.T.1A.1 TaxID=1483602 RepID=UPI000621183A|nr:hypothetical protein [Methanosarcina sp. 1.H.T.1A.1]KKH99588.1 hypothetical protein EO95_13800 [Methanosarcina sp. 1.H.T.1A.1]